MKGVWMIDGNHIALRFGEEILHPNAQEIYEVLSDEQNSFVAGINCIPVAQAFPDVYFSKIGSNIRCILEADDSQEIILKLCCNRKDIEVEVDLIDGQIIDQCICGKDWFYVTGSTAELEEVFARAGIKETGKITVSQYVEIIRSDHVFEKGTLTNRVEISALDKPVDTDEKLPYGLQAKLYKYQKTGYFWMRYMMLENGGCILGDEMGLGKTLQVITLMLNYKHTGKVPMLVVAPVSLLQNWKQECGKFAPSLRTLIHHGTKRTGRFKELEEYDVVIVSYNTAVSDISILSMINWTLVVLDEAQNIKNPESNRTRFVKKIPRQSCIAVTGTPFENHVTDIWSLVDFVKPGLLGTQSEYTAYITDDVEGADKVEPLLSPIMIRRMVKNVAQDLPEKIVIPQPLEMSELEAVRYEEYREDAKNETDSGKINIGILQKLRMFCTHPMVCENTSSEDPAGTSIKYQRMCEIIEEICKLKEKVILFTSYQKMFDILDKDIPERFNIPVLKINGATPVESRQAIVDTFNNMENSALLVLNPRAAGTGLNITSANHVIHYNLEWNPALEDQASARAYRRGQRKTVFIYRLFYIDTVEQIVNERIERKREMANAAVVGTDGNMQNREDIIAALSVSPVKEKKR
jgi:SNF2 family DNA or RNA helicase